MRLSHEVVPLLVPHLPPRGILRCTNTSNGTSAGTTENRQRWGKNKGEPKLRDSPLFFGGGPSGVRTRVFAVRGRRPGPLDDGTGWLGSQGSNLETVGQSHV